MYQSSTYRKAFIGLLITVMLVGCSATSTSSEPNGAQSIASHVGEDTIIDEQSESAEKIEEVDDSSDDLEQSIVVPSEAPLEAELELEPPLTESPSIVKLYQLPEGFVYLDDVITNASFELRYYTDNNFVGEPVVGYKAPFAVGTKAMANALLVVSEELEKQGYRIHIYDAYRPVKAVEQFIEWSKAAGDDKMKEQFYPNIDKSQLFEQGYLSKRSAHSRGSTVDLTLVDNVTDLPLDMGGPYDLLDERSHYASQLITTEQASNRKLLKQAMEKVGFKAYSKEWWHFVLVKEPYSSTYFEFDIE